MLQQDPALLPVPQGPRRLSVASPAGALGSILVAPLKLDSLEVLAALAEPLARKPQREIILVGTVADSDPVRLDDRGQAVVSTSLVRIAAPRGERTDPVLEPVSRLDGVDQSVGGLLAPSLSPDAGPAACKRRRPPSWARPARDTPGRAD